VPEHFDLHSNGHRGGHHRTFHHLSANITLECTVLPITDNTGMATATDCSGVKSITFVDALGTANCTGKRAITRTWTAEDNCGNKSTCAQLIDFKDTVAPRN